MALEVDVFVVESDKIETSDVAREAAGLCDEEPFVTPLAAAAAAAAAGEGATAEFATVTCGAPEAPCTARCPT